MSNPVTKLKQKHRRTAFQLLLNQKEISRTDLARELGVSLQTSMKIMNYFEEFGFAHYIGEAETSFGRRPQMYALCPESAHIIGIVHEGSVIHACITNLAFDILVEDTADMRSNIEDVIAEQTCEIAQSMLQRLEQKGVTITRLLGLGIGLPGVINDITAEVSYAPSLSISNTYSIGPLLKLVEERLMTRVTIENDVNASVYGEYDGKDDLAFLSIGSGVGMGLVIDGKVRHGKHFRAGEIESIRLDGGHNGIENVIGLSALKRRWGFDRRFGIGAMPIDARNNLISEVSNAAARILAFTSSVLDITDFVVGGLTIELMGDELFNNIVEKTKSLATDGIKISKQSLSCPALIGVCRKIMDLYIHELLSYDDEAENEKTQQQGGMNDVKF